MLKLSTLSLATLSALAVMTSISHAQTATEPAPAAASDDAALTLGTITVQTPSTGTLATRSILSSVDILSADVLQDQHVDYSWELLTRAPGVQVTQFKQGTDAGRFSMRGFNGEGRINAVKLLIDGIPSNDNAGGMPFLDAVFALDMDAIEIVRGTNDPRYGLHNIAGNAHVITRQGGNDGQASITLGSFGTRELQLVKGFENGNWSQNYFIGTRESDGYRDHADADKKSLAGKWFYTSDNHRWRAGIIARYYKNEALESGYLSAAQAHSTPRSSPSYAAWDRSKRQTMQYSAHVEAQLDHDLFWTAKAYTQHYENQRFVRFSAAGVQQERDNDETHKGLISTLTWRPKVDWAYAFTLEGGLDAQWQDNTAQRYRTIQRSRTSQIRDWDFELNTRGVYMQAVVQPVQALKIIPALRVDRISGSFTDGLTKTTSATHDYGTITQPKISVVYSLRPDTSVYANWGRSFQIGTGIDSYRTASQSRNLDASRNNGWEAGVKWQPATGIETRVAYWEQRASGEVARVLGVNGLPDPGGQGNVGRTIRKGADVQLNARLNAQYSGWIAYSSQISRIVTPDPSAPATAGKEIENVPHYLATLGMSYQAHPQLTLSAWANAQGNYYLERTNRLGRTGGYALLNLSATWRVSPTVDIGLQLKNVTDRKYVYAWYDSGSSGYAPGDGRSAYASLSYKF